MLLSVPTQSLRKQTRRVTYDRECYETPEVTTYSDAEIREELGTAQAVS